MNLELLFRAAFLLKCNAIWKKGFSLFLNLESFQKNIASERQKQQRSILGQYLTLYHKKPKFQANRTDWNQDMGHYRWKNVYFLPFSKYIDGNTNWGDAACVMSCLPTLGGLEGLFNFHVHEAEMLLW